MKQRTIEVTNARGELKKAQIIWPESLAEAVTLLGEPESFEVITQAYLAECERTLRRIRSKRLSFRLVELTPQQIDGLKALGLYK